MRLTVDIDTGSEGDTIADGAGELAADLLRELADRAEIGGIVSGPLWDRRGDEPRRVGRFSYTISRERV